MSIAENGLDHGADLWIVQRGQAPQQLVDDTLTLLRNAGALIVTSEASTSPVVPSGQAVELGFIGPEEFQNFSATLGVKPDHPVGYSARIATRAYNAMLWLAYRQNRTKDTASWMTKLILDPQYSETWKKVSDIEQARPSVSATSLLTVATSIEEHLVGKPKSQLKKYVGTGIEKGSIGFWREVSRHYLDKQE